jgi:hypothetical protein
MTEQIKPWESEYNESLKDNEEQHEEDIHAFGQVVARRAGAHLKEFDQLKQ